MTAILSTPLWPVPALAWAVLFIVLFWGNVRDAWHYRHLTRADFVFLACWLFLPLAFSAAGRYLP